MVFGFVGVVVVSGVVIVGCCWCGLLYRNSKNTPNTIWLLLVWFACLLHCCVCDVFCLRVWFVFLGFVLGVMLSLFAYLLLGCCVCSLYVVCGVLFVSRCLGCLCCCCYCGCCWLLFVWFVVLKQQKTPHQHTMIVFVGMACLSFFVCVFVCSLSDCVCGRVLCCWGVVLFVLFALMCLCCGVWCVRVVVVGMSCCWLLLVWFVVLKQQNHLKSNTHIYCCWWCRLFVFLCFVCVFCFLCVCSLWLVFGVVSFVV